MRATTVTGTDRSIQVAAPDGSDVRTLRDLPGVDDSAPAFSPDGRRIAFESDADGDVEIHVMDADGGGVLQLTRNAEHDEGPSWSPDGTRIAFTRGPDDADGDIWTMAADGADQRRRTRVRLAATLRPATARRLGLARRIARRERTLPAGATVVRLRFSARAAKRLRGARLVRLRLSLAGPHAATVLPVTLRR